MDVSDSAYAGLRDADCNQIGGLVASEQSIEDIKARFRRTMSLSDMEHSEMFLYKVSYAGGIYIRKAPQVDAISTDEILPCGTVFEADKSIMIDGVNYVRLGDGRGWVFEKKGDLTLLTLLDCIRKTRSTNDLTQLQRTNSFILDNYVRNRPQHVRRGSNARGVWRDVREKALACKTLSEFIAVVKRSKDGEFANLLFPSLQEQEGFHTTEIAKWDKIARVVAVLRHGCQELDLALLHDSLWCLVQIGEASNTIANRIAQEAEIRAGTLSQESRDTAASFFAILGKRAAPILREITGPAGLTDLTSFLESWFILRLQRHEPPVIPTSSCSHESESDPPALQEPSGAFTQPVSLLDTFLTGPRMLLEYLAFSTHSQLHDLQDPSLQLALGFS